MSGHFSLGTRSSPLVSLIFLLILAGGLRGGIVILRSHLLNDDRDAYQEIARHMESGAGFSLGTPPRPTAFRPPLYPILLAGLFSAGGSTLTVGWFQVAIGLATVWLTWLLGRELQLGIGAWFAAALVAVDPLLLQNTVLIMTETTCVFLVTLWLWYWLKLRNRKQPLAYRERMILGILFGFCCLCRPTFLATGVLIAVCWCFQLCVRGTMQSASWGRVFWEQIAAGFPVVLGILILLGPWMLRNGFVVGKFTPATTHGGYTLLLGNNPVFYSEVIHGRWGTVWSPRTLLPWQKNLETDMQRELSNPNDEVSRDRWMYDRAWENIVARPGDFLVACGYRLSRFFAILPRGEQAELPGWLLWGVGAFYAFEIIGFLGGLYVTVFRRQVWSPFWFVLMGTLLVHTFYWTDLRMRAPLIPVIAIFSTMGWMALQSLLNRRT